MAGKAPLRTSLPYWMAGIATAASSSACPTVCLLPRKPFFKWYRTWRAEHPEFEKIVFDGLRHSSATYQLLQSGGDFKSVQGNTAMQPPPS